jgi:hypothetical protein
MQIAALKLVSLPRSQTVAPRTEQGRGSERSLAMWWVDLVGYAAAVAVLGSFCMSTIVPLRLLAVVSNVLFGVYGVLAHLYPVFFLHFILLPINLFKLARTRPSAGARRMSGPIP